MESNSSYINVDCLFLNIMFNFIIRIWQRLFPKKNEPSEVVPDKPEGKTVGNQLKEAKDVDVFASKQALQEVQIKIDIAFTIMLVIFVALVVCFITLFFEYQAFIAQSFNEYNNQVKELKNEKDSFYNLRLLNVENKVATMSGK